MTGSDHGADPDLDSILNVLADRYRRRVLVALLEHNPQDDDDPQTPEDITMGDEDLEELMIEMEHTHLPKLAAAGLIEWDRETNVIKKGPEFAEIEPLLRLMHEHRDELPEGWL